MRLHAFIKIQCKTAKETHAKKKERNDQPKKKTEHTMQKFIININAINALCRVAMRVTESMKCTHTIERQKKNTHTHTQSHRNRFEIGMLH